MEERIEVLNPAPLRPDRAYVLYWMTAARRTSGSFALDRAMAHARALGRPLLVFEPLRRGYRWASARVHQFVVDGMADQARALGAAGVTYLPYVEPEDGAGKGLLAALAAHAAVVVTDVFPAFFLPKMLASARADARLEAVDGYGLLPLGATDRVYTTAASFRRHLHKVLPPHLERFPSPSPLAGYDLGRAQVPAEISARWPAADPHDPQGVGRLGLPGPAPVAVTGGARAGARAVDTFFASRLARYLDRNEPDADAASGLSPYLHFGHVSAHEVVARVLATEGWTPERLGPVTGSREGWWGLSPPAEAFLDELVTWREVGAAFCRHEPRYDQFDTLPGWARATLAAHAADRRPVVYELDALAAATTHDPVWNAAQRQLVAEGRIHNYLRMLWGKKVLEWSPSPEAAWEVLIELNNRFALDGRDANSYAGIGWTFGRFDRAWGPERPIYGTVRYMSSDNTRRKLALTNTLARWGR